MCSVKLDSRNKTGYCTPHKGDRKISCTKCETLIYAGSKTKLCKPCYQTNYYKLNKDRINTYYNNIYHKNKEIINKKRGERERERWHTDFDFRFKKSLRARFKKAVKEEWRTGSFIDSLGCSIEDLKTHLKSQFQPGMSWDNYGEWEIDHIVPFCKIDLSNWEQLKSVIHYTNLQPLWKKDHIKKTVEDRSLNVLPEK